MNKELEALKGIKQAIAEHLHKQTGVSVEKHFEYLQNDTEINIVEQALTPPTADEVCEALSDYLKDKVIYNDRFGFICNERVIICLYPNNVLNFNKNYPAHIHNIVGRFYEGENT